MKMAYVNIMKALYNCGVLTKSSISKCGGDEISIKEMVEARWLKREPIEVKDKRIAVYSLTKLGEKIYAEIVNSSYFYRCHNTFKAISISYVYSKLSMESQESWRSKDMLLSKHEEYKIVPDAVYIEDGLTKAVIALHSDEKEEKCMALEQFKQDYSVSELTVMIY